MNKWLAALFVTAAFYILVIGTVVLVVSATTSHAIIIVQTVGTSGVAPPDRRTGIEMVYLFESEMAGDNADNTGSDAAICDLVDNSGTGTVDRISGSAPEGSLEASFDDGKNQSLSNSNATCNNNWQQDANFTYGCRLVPRNITENMRPIDFNFNTTTGSYLQLAIAPTAIWRCQVKAAASTKVADATTLPAVATEAFVVCRYNASTDVIEVYVDGVDEDDGTTAPMDASTVDFILGIPDSNHDWEGKSDECFFTADILTDPELCTFCSCGIKADDCRCDAGTPANYLACSDDDDCEGAVCDTVAGTCRGFNDAKCNNCTPTDCDATAF